MTTTTIKHNTPDYERLIRLRIHTLLLPIGVPETYIDREKEKNDVFIGAFDQEDLVGGCVLTLIEPAVFQLRQMAVRTEYQGKNVGAKIIQYAETISRDMNITRIFLNARDPVIGFMRNVAIELKEISFLKWGSRTIK